jgi:hypothetical protein
LEKAGRDTSYSIAKFLDTGLGTLLSWSGDRGIHWGPAGVLIALFHTASTIWDSGRRKTMDTSEVLRKDEEGPGTGAVTVPGSGPQKPSQVPALLGGDREND